MPRPARLQHAATMHSARASALRSLSTRSLLARAIAPALPLLALAACGEGDDESFDLRTSTFSFDSAGLLDVQGVYALGLADEDGGLTSADLNEDSDTSDGVLVAIDLTTGDQFVSGAAAREVHSIGTNLYLVVDEAGNNQWNTVAADETVLLRWNPAELEPEFVTTLIDGGTAIESGGRLWFNSSQAPVATDETTLRFVDASAPEVAQTVFSAAGTTGSVIPEILSEQDGLLVLSLDESVNGDQNADTDSDDERVIAFVEAAHPNPELLTSSLAAPTSGQVIEVRLRAIDVWDIALLVSEEAQNANLNGTLLQPAQCSSGADTDQDEDVLHLARFELGALSAFTNTELPGATNPAANRLLLTEGTVGVASQEAGYGPAPGCDLNGDTDFDDLIWRWAPLGDPTNAETSLGLMRSIDPALAGGARGVIALADRYVVAERQLVANPETPEFLARLGWIDPVAGVAYDEEFFDPDDLDASQAILVAVDWMAEDPIGGLAPIAALEGPTGFNLNVGCSGIPKDAGSIDLEDSLASWLLFSTDRNEMILAGRGWAVQPTNSGLTVAATQAFFRVSEASDGFDWNGDLDISDTILFRVPLNSCDPTNMGVLNTFADTPAIISDGVFGGAFLADESMEGADLNGDGVIGLALRTFRF